jgi:putative flippase GtrA
METLSGALCADPALRIQRLLREFVQYVVVGGVAFFVDWFLLTRSMVWFGLDYRIATAVGFLAGLVTNYTFCVIWVWRGTKAQTVKDFLVFAAIGVAGLGLTELGMWIGVGLAGFGASPVKVAVAAVVLIWNFVLRKFMVFNH